jgi:hypothetical protein
MCSCSFDLLRFHHYALIDMHGLETVMLVMDRPQVVLVTAFVAVFILDFVVVFILAFVVVLDIILFMM